MRFDSEQERQVALFRFCVMSSLQQQASCAGLQRYANCREINVAV